VGKYCEWLLGGGLCLVVFLESSSTEMAKAISLVFGVSVAPSAGDCLLLRLVSCPCSTIRLFSDRTIEPTVGTAWVSVPYLACTQLLLSWFHDDCKVSSTSDCPAPSRLRRYTSSIGVLLEDTSLSVMHRKASTPQSRTECLKLLRSISLSSDS
jgi:hypothetical protein